MASSELKFMLSHIHINFPGRSSKSIRLMPGDIAFIRALCAPVLTEWRAEDRGQEEAHL